MDEVQVSEKDEAVSPLREPPRIARADSVPIRELIAGRSGERLSFAASLSDHFALTHLLVHRETLLPGRRASPPHDHTRKEELFIVVAGEPSLWFEGTRIPLRPGDAVGFRPGDGARMIVNESVHEAVILTIGTNDPDDNVLFARE